MFLLVDGPKFVLLRVWSLFMRSLRINSGSKNVKNACLNETHANADLDEFTVLSESYYIF